jgi:2-polyprenyl-3-methyl-5-hydroxy-6-metoxy-1,4-benzoquinol methylase
MQHNYGYRTQDYKPVPNRDNPARKRELTELEEAMRSVLRKRDVLEIACGNGYWTERAMPAVNRITATDMTPMALEIAMAKKLPADKVRFEQSDAYELSCIPGDYNAGMAICWLSHVPFTQIRSFLDAFHNRLGYGAIVFFADYVYPQGIGGEWIQQSSNPYYLEDQLLDFFGLYTKELHLHMGESFWYVYYEAIPCAGRRV